MPADETIHGDGAAGELRIGQAAALAGVSTRTLRFYEERGLLQPPARSTGGTRRYSAADVAKLLRIRELQSVMGFNLTDIQAILHAEDRLQELREEFSADAPRERRLEITAEALRVTEELRVQVVDRLEKVRSFLETLDERTARYHAYLEKEAQAAPGGDGGGG
jgi:MerR family transcriptional regulator, repressor of the yfmOP operon